MTKEQCSLCKFWERRYESLEDATDAHSCDATKAKHLLDEGMCRRYPPQFFTIEDNLVFNNNFRVFGERSDFFTQPSTQYFDWCGEYKPAT
jgi:hypothetical protein